MIHIPAGTYGVGSTAAQREQLAQQYGFDLSLLVDELDARDVSLEAFYVDEYPVTNAQYAAFIAATDAPEPYDWPLHASVDRADHPVVGVGGDDAAAYAQWAGKRLPTPEQWEVAFRGMGAMGDRPPSAGQWDPKTFARGDDAGPVSEFGVGGFGQVCEWTTATIQRGQFPFRMLKGACWFCAESWSLRPQAGFYAFGPWCRQWTGFRCVADTDVTAPTGELPAQSQPTYHTQPSIATDGVHLSYGGGRGGGAVFPGVGEALGVACPEGILLDGDPPGPDDVRDISSSGAVEGPGAACDYRFAAGPVEMAVTFRAGSDYLDMKYTFANTSDQTHTIQPSTCVNAGLMDPFFDLEGRRSHLWTGRGEWRTIRSLPRQGSGNRWISYVTLPDEHTGAVLLGVEGSGGQMVFGYGRVDMDVPPALANNYCFSCLHLDPVVTLGGGGHSSTRARLYCIRGGLDDLRERFVRDFAL